MIVLHEQKIIALKARKVGGTSFEIALSKFAHKDSIITPITFDDEKLRESLGYLGPQNYKYKTEEIKKIEPVIEKDNVINLENLKNEDIFVLTWTVNDKRFMKKLLKIGVDGIITDFPKKLAKLLSQHGQTF